MEKYFIHIPRTGGTSMASSLPFGCAIYLGHDLRNPDYRHPATICTDGDYNFAVVRDPHDRLISAFDFLRSGGNCDADRHDAEALGIETGRFREFVTDRLAEAATWQIHMRPQSFYLRGVPDPQLFSFGDADAAFREICGVLDVDPGTPLQSHNKSAPHQQGDYYDDETRKIVAEVYREDLELIDQLGH